MSKAEPRRLGNSVLVISEPSKGQTEKKTIFIPAYLRVAFKKITAIEVTSNQGEMSATVILTIHLKGLSSETKNEIKKRLNIGINNEMFFSMNTNPDKHRNFEEGNFLGQQDDNLEEYTVHWRNKFPLEMECNVFWTPFEVIELSIGFAMRSITWNQGKTQITVKFNFMDSPNSDLITKFSLQQNEDFGDYGLAQSYVKAQYSTTSSKKKKKTQEQKEKKKKQQPQEVPLNQSSTIKVAPKQGAPKKPKVSIKQWQYAQFSIAVYRYPFTSVVTIYFPILLLAVINLCIFFQNYNLAERIASIATLMVAYTAFLPTIRESIPPSPSITLVDIILYSLISTCFLCLLRSWFDRALPDTELYVWQYDPLYILSVVLICLSALFVILGLLVYKCIWEKKYNEGQGMFKHQKREKFDSSKWGCDQADEHYANLGKEVKVCRIPEKTKVDFTTPSHEQIILTLIESEVSFIKQKNPMIFFQTPDKSKQRLDQYTGRAKGSETLLKAQPV